MMARYGQITREGLLEQHRFFIERARTAQSQGSRVEALKKAATTRRMIAKDPTLREWVIRRTERTAA